ncbi:YoaK family protein [uncultured Paludibaculum sp.]|uniref:YoaK family protein n=1 Tax=uncultured Paludibaculum sp. TaxID=1765020 RepID=UPI002AAA654C|nr:YoaK family protein [uncultured Paludibaculum sp.]
MSAAAQPSGAPAAQPDRSAALVVALLLLTFGTGLIDAVSFLGLGHIFTANMTGNIVFLGFASAGVPGLSIVRSLTSLGSFLLGAVAGGRFAQAFASISKRRWLFVSTLTEAALLGAALLAADGFDIRSGAPPQRLYVVIVTTAVAMGMRNATIRRLAVPDLTTTVLTLTLTGIAADSALAGGSHPRLNRRLAAVLLMFAGAAAGAFLLNYGLAAPLGLCLVSTLAAGTAFRSASLEK